MQPVGAVAMLAARVCGGTDDARLDAGIMARGQRGGRARYFARSLCRAGGSGRVQIVVDETRQQVVSGSLEDQAIQRLLLTAAKDPSDAGLRVESVDLLKNRPQSAEVRSALLYALQHDPNAGRAAESLGWAEGICRAIRKRARRLHRFC